jgi:hypothetical protein
MSDATTNFRPSARNDAVMKKGAQAEASRAQVKENHMLSTIKTERQPQGIGNTLTVFGDKETARQRQEEENAVQWFAEQMLRAEHEIFSEVVTITPALATIILRRNPDNRGIDKVKLAEIRSDLETGAWALNGESIVIDKNGFLNDGQHRLMAVRDSLVPMRSIVVFGVPRNTRQTVDQGKARTIADYLEMSGKPEDARVVAAIARMILFFKETSTVDTRRRKGIAPLTKGAILNAALDHATQIKRSIAKIGPRGTIFGKKSLLAFVHLKLSEKAPVAADDFMAGVLDGANLSADSAIYSLRQRLINDPSMTQPDRFEAFIRAWNAFRREEPLTKIQIMGRVPKIGA